jgi:hypothetical protein
MEAKTRIPTTTANPKAVPEIFAVAHRVFVALIIAALCAKGHSLLACLPRMIRHISYLKWSNSRFRAEPMTSLGDSPAERAS